MKEAFFYGLLVLFLLFVTVDAIIALSEEDEE